MLRTASTYRNKAIPLDATYVSRSTTVGHCVQAARTGTGELLPILRRARAATKPDRDKCPTSTSAVTKPASLTAGSLGRRRKECSDHSRPGSGKHCRRDGTITHSEEMHLQRTPFPNTFSDYPLVAVSRRVHHLYTFSPRGRQQAARRGREETGALLPMTWGGMLDIGEG